MTIMSVYKRKSSYLFILGLAVLLPILLYGLKEFVRAEIFTTDVTVGNSAPEFTDGPREDPTSSGTNPTNVGSNVTFEATAEDSNSEDYYLAICKTNSVTPVNGDAPTCGGGNWCISTVTTSGQEASCNYTALIGDAESNAWFAFVCDDNASAASCSTAEQGSGDSGSPFKVNHAPTFSAITDDGGTGANSGANPGGTMTFTATASDADSDTLQDTVKLVVCADTDGATAAGCAGVQICASSFVASNPTCELSIPAVAPDGSFNYYAYVFDNHSFGSASNYRSGEYVINNVAPVVTAGTLNGGNDITLTEGDVTEVIVTATVSDANSCQDLTTVDTSVYRTGITYTGCDTSGESDDNYCYGQITCTVVGGTCTGSTDSTASYTCSVDIQYHADPTIADTEYPTEEWIATIRAIDNNSASDTDDTAEVDMLTTVGIDIYNNVDSEPTLSFGSLDVGQKNDPLDKIMITEATGNVGINQELSGTDLDDGDTGVIDVGYQKYSLTVSTAYASGTSLTDTPALSLINVLKTTSSVSPATKNTWWGIEIPTGIPPGVYSGSNTSTAVMSDVLDW